MVNFKLVEIIFVKSFQMALQGHFFPFTSQQLLGAGGGYYSIFQMGQLKFRELLNR